MRDLGAEQRPLLQPCGSALVSDDLPTLSSPTAGTPQSSRPPSSQRSGAADRTDEPRFLPGTILAGRYRIVALLGRGGMGEVYRADDLTLGQPVALKFLPESAGSEEMLARFRNEVRIARRVSHRNVCRVYDIGEAEGRHFLSMEYVDGEDLASLLKRIGRLPADKATDVARRVCAGLAAAHEKGVLHRDLKPANVMLDRQGEVVITDFGLAVLADQVPQHDLRSGTPTYMAPEQLAGGRGHAEERPLRARPRAVRDLHRPPRVRREDARTAAAADARQQTRQPLLRGEGPRPRGRARHPLVPRARARAPAALGAGRGGGAAGRRPAGGRARGRPDALAGGSGRGRPDDRPARRAPQ